MTREEIEARCDALKAELLAEHDKSNAKAPSEAARDVLRAEEKRWNLSGERGYQWMFREGVRWFWDATQKEYKWSTLSQDLLDRIKMKGSWVSVPGDEPNPEPKRGKVERTEAKTPAEAALDRMYERPEYPCAEPEEDRMWMYREGVREAVEAIRKRPAYMEAGQDYMLREWEWRSEDRRVFDEVEKKMTV